MLRVKKGNQEFRIPDEELTNYLKKGFDLIDERGQVVTLGTNEQSVEQIARENKELRRKNRQLEEGVKRRDSIIADLRRSASSVAAAEDLPTENSDQKTLFDEADGESAELRANESVAAAEDQFVCPTCGRVCASRLGLAKHMKSHG